MNTREHAEGGFPLTVDGNPFGASPGCFAAFDAPADYARMVRAGLRHIEVLAVGASHFSSLAPEEMDEAEVAHLRETLQTAGLTPMSAAIAAPLHDAAGLALLKRRLDFAHRLGVPVAQAGAGEARDAAERRTLLRHLAAAGDYAATLGLVLALEIHPGLTVSGHAARELMAELDHPHVRINYDTGNVVFYNDLDPAEDVEEIAAFVAQVHLKDKGTRQQRAWDFVPIGQGVVNFPRIVEVLRAVGFQGPYSLELELPGVADGALPKEASEEGIRESIAYLQRIGLLPQKEA
jgi:inosose dehydratase